MVNCGNLSKDSILTKMDEPNENSRAPENLSSPKLISYLYFWDGSYLAEELPLDPNGWFVYRDIWRNTIAITLAMILFMGIYYLINSDPEFFQFGMSLYILFFLPLYWWYEARKIRHCQKNKGWAMAAAIITPFFLIFLSILLFVIYVDIFPS